MSRCTEFTNKSRDATKFMNGKKGRVCAPVEDTFANKGLLLRTLSGRKKNPTETNPRAHLRRISNRRQSMSNNEHRSADDGSIDRLLHQVLALGVESARRLPQEIGGSSNEICTGVLHALRRAAERWDS